MRPQDWDQRLSAYFAQRLGRPHQWNGNCCVLYSADAIVAMMAWDPIADLRGRWSTEGEAREVLAELGGLRRAVTDRLGPPMPLPAMAHRGDVVYFELAGEPTIGICDGAFIATPGKEGTVKRRMRHAICAWGIGRG